MQEDEVSLLDLLVIGPLLFVFMRQAWRNAAQDPDAAPKIARLRAAFGSRKP
ncbi:hypothetical protein [Rhodoferax sp.]|uniref:hypothetical protein n=1 Tax=Rhodoferax sp. TaxID=50421 RepID=UPI0019DA1B5D|nr:hypothetical protein [Rhodoferax sp.]MBE0475447.1 hypothetical protein [Rhodoferax sp.]